MLVELVQDHSRLILIDQGFQDFGQFEAAVDDWNLDFILLSKGGFDANLHYSAINNCVLGKATFHCRLEQRGEAPKGMRTFVVPASDRVSYHWRRRHITGSTLQLFPKNGELFSVSGKNFSCYIISFPERHFQEAAKSLGYDLQGAKWEKAFVWEEKESDVLNLRNWCSLYQQGFIDKNDTLLQMLISSFAFSEKVDKQAHNYDQLVETIRGLIMSNSGEIIKVKDLVTATGFSERTIQYAFNSVYGISPMDYVKRYRLHAVYNELNENPGKLITDVANKYGFWHMGQFAKDFRKMYGCLPSAVVYNK